MNLKKTANMVRMSKLAEYLLDEKGDIQKRRDILLFFKKMSPIIFNRIKTVEDIKRDLLSQRFLQQLKLKKEIEDELKERISREVFGETIPEYFYE